MENNNFWETVKVVNNPQEIPLGISENTIWHYLDVVYLNGLINHIKPLKVLFHWDSKKDTKNYALSFIEQISKTKNTNYLGTNITIIGETQNDFWLFISQDLDDCSIGRFSKNLTSLDEIIEASSIFVKPNFITEALPLPKGWITF